MPLHPPIIIVVGPTASGKSALAIEIAKKINGEIISVDSRQVYRGMDIGTGKVTATERKRIPHHLLDIESPKHDYNVSHFLRDAKRTIEDIEKRGKRVILCGGTTFWIEALVFGAPLPAVPPDKAFRERWSQHPNTELYAYLKRLDPERAKTIDKHNKIRLLRAIEIAKALGKVPALPETSFDTEAFLFIGIECPVEELNKKIRERLKLRLKQGMEKEVEELKRIGVSWEKLESFGLEYRAIARMLQGKITKQEMQETLPLDIIHYAKRQRSSLRRLEKKGITIHWVKDGSEALEILKG